MQTSYANPSTGYAGQLLNQGEVPDLEALSVEGAEIAFGTGVISGTNKETQIKTPAAVFTLAQFRGVVIATAARIERLYKQVGLPKVPVGEAIDVLRQGYAKVLTKASPISRGDAVYLQHTAGGVYAPGDLHNDAAQAANAVDVSAVAAWYRGVSVAGEYATIQLSIKG